MKKESLQKQKMFKLKNKKNTMIKKGMSLIEVVMLIAIIGIMTSISIVSLVRVKVNNDLEVAAEELVSVIREAQNYSLTGKGNIADCSNYRVLLSNGSSNYVLRSYSGPLAGSAVCNNVNSLYRFKNGVVVSVGGGYVNFEAPHGNVTRTAGQLVSSIWYRVTFSRTGFTSQYVCFNGAGLVKRTLDPNCVN